MVSPSEQEFETKLNDPGRSSAEYTAEARAGQRRIRIAEAHLVEQVEELGAEHLFCSVIAKFLNAEKSQFTALGP
jgi:hypothetical protein